MPEAQLTEPLDHAVEKGGVEWRSIRLGPDCRRSRTGAAGAGRSEPRSTPEDED